MEKGKAVVQQSIVMPIWRTVAFEIKAAVLLSPKSNDAVALVGAAADRRQSL